MVSLAPDSAEHRASSPSPVRVGAVLPSTQWMVEAWIRRGPGGEVFEARHVQLDRRAQLEVFEDPEVRFREQLRRVARIDSPFVVRVLDVIELGPNVAVITEDVPDLRMSAPIGLGPTPVARLIGLGRQLCKAVFSLHEHGLLHGGIEPNTIVSLDRGARIKLQGPASTRPTAEGATEPAATPEGDLRGVTASVRWLARQHDIQMPPPLTEVLERSAADGRAPGGGAAAQLERELCEVQRVLGLEHLEISLDRPAIEAQQRRRLDPHRPSGRPERRRPWGPVLVGLVVLVAITSGLVLRARARSAEDATAQGLAQRARDAAARARYVYPPPNEPNADTSFRMLLELERAVGVDHPLGRSLRDQFAETLVFLGDKYWASRGGQTFALDYYAQALLFRPDDLRARQRGRLTPGHLALFHRRAERSDFTEAELWAVEPLAIMADPDHERRRTRLRTLLSDARVWPRGIEQELRALVDDGDAVEPVATATQPEPAPPPRGPVDSTPAADADRSPRSGSASQVAALSAQAKRTFAQGHWRRAQSVWNQALALDPRCAPCLMGLSDVAFERARHHEAVDYARRAVRLAPQRGGYRIRLGDAYMKVLKYDDAAQQYQRAAQLGHPQAAECLARVRAKTRP